MKERRKFITEETIVEINEEAFKIKAEELMYELFVEFVNSHFPSPVVELKL